MERIARRGFLRHLSVAFPLSVSFRMANTQTVGAPPETDLPSTDKTAWLEAVFGGTRAFGTPAVLSKFNDGMYYLRQPMSWAPEDAHSTLHPVAVPTGFVTDLASIPQPFWSVMPRDGQYAEAAIIHDYLYWRQPVSKDEADLVLKEAMQELQVSPVTVAVIYGGVRSVFGDRAWASNQKIKAGGERRILKAMPGSPVTKWTDWKRMPENFVDE